MRAFYAALVFVFTLCLSVPGFAQQASVDYAAWKKQADQIEEVVQSGTASDARLEALRADVVKWREQFANGQGANAARIATLRDQIKALGPAPAEGEKEATDVAQRRQELNDQLAKAQAPGRVAVEAFSRADGIVQSIDKQLRARQARALMQVSPSPLNPLNWPKALEALRAIGAGISTEIMAQSGEKDVGYYKEVGPIVLGLALLALLILTKGRQWVARLPHRLSKRASETSRAAVEFVVSLLEILVPMVGIGLLIGALLASRFFGPWGEPILLALFPAGCVFFIGWWLIARIFPRNDRPSVLDLSPSQKGRARSHAMALNLILSIYIWLTNSILPQQGGSRVMTDTTIPYQVGDAASAVLFLPLIAVAALVFYRLSNILRRTMRKIPEDAITMRSRLVLFFGSVGMLAALAAPILAAVGYVHAANALLWPSIMSFALLGLMIVLQEFVADLYMAARRGKADRDALFPMLLGFLLALAMLPVFALVWGARWSDIFEVWTSIRQGVTLGGIKLSPTAALTFIIVFLIGLGITRTIQGAVRNSVLPKTRLDAGAQTAAVSGIGYIGIFLAALLAITSAGIDLSSLAIVAGALSVGIGFGLQNIVSNFVSGIILLIERPITVGDWIEVGGRQGYVRRISVRSTRIETFDRTDVIVPNADFVSGQVVNYTRGNLSGRLIVPVGVAYGTDTRRVEKILQEIADDQPLAMLYPPPTVIFTGFGANSLDFEIRIILSDVNQSVHVRSEVNHKIAERFTQEGIEIPYPQRDLWLRNPEALHKAWSGRKTDAVNHPHHNDPPLGTPGHGVDDAPDLSGPDAGEGDD